MARTIGKRNTETVIELTRHAVTLGHTGTAVYDYVHNRTESKQFNSYENAYDEIDRIISDNYNPHLNNVAWW